MLHEVIMPKVLTIAHRYNKTFFIFFQFIMVS